MDENVSKAVKKADQYCGMYERGFAVKNAWDVIRARLVELEAENERLQAQLDAGTEAGWHALRNERDELRRQLSELRESTHYANGVADLAMKHRDAAESRLAAADALLRKCRDEFARLPRSLGYDFTHLPEIDAHLSENTHG